MTEKSDDAAVAKANLVEHLKNIAIACDDARLSENHRIEEEVQKAQNCLSAPYLIGSALLCARARRPERRWAPRTNNGPPCLFNTARLSPPLRALIFPGQTAFSTR